MSARTTQYLSRRSSSWPRRSVSSPAPRKSGKNRAGSASARWSTRPARSTQPRARTGQRSRIFARRCRGCATSSASHLRASTRQEPRASRWAARANLSSCWPRPRVTRKSTPRSTSARSTALSKQRSPEKAGSARTRCLPANGTCQTWTPASGNSGRSPQTRSSPSSRR